MKPSRRIGLLAIAALAALLLLATTPVNASALAVPAACAREGIAAKEFDREYLLKDAATIEKLENLTAEMEYLPGYRAILPSKNGSGAYLVVDDQASEQLIASAESTGLQVVQSCVTSNDLKSAEAALRSLDISKDDYWSIGYTPFGDAISISSSLPGTEIQAALLDAGLTSELVQTDALTNRELDAGTSPIQFYQGVPGELGRNVGRSNDGSPHYGGAQIWANGGMCSSGFTVVNNTGQRAIMSAGHCVVESGGSVGQNWRAGPGGAGAPNFGNVESYTFPDPDLMAIQGSVYTNRVYHLADNTSNKAVTGSGEPMFNVSYCNFGAVGLRICTGYVELSASVNVGGVTTNLARALSAPGCPFGRLSRQGDSGGPIGLQTGTANVSARGIQVVGTREDVPITSTTRCQRYDHKWSTVVAIYGVSIVTTP